MMNAVNGNDAPNKMARNRTLTTETQDSVESEDRLSAGAREWRISTLYLPIELRVLALQS